MKIVEDVQYLRQDIDWAIIFTSKKKKKKKLSTEINFLCIFPTLKINCRKN